MRFSRSDSGTVTPSLSVSVLMLQYAPLRHDEVLARVILRYASVIDGNSDEQFIRR